MSFTYTYILKRCVCVRMHEMDNERHHERVLRQAEVTDHSEATSQVSQLFVDDVNERHTQTTDRTSYTEDNVRSIDIVNDNIDHSHTGVLRKQVDERQYQILISQKGI